MLTASQIALIKDSVPFLKEHGMALTTLFYQRMLEGHPELAQIFNGASQDTGARLRALAHGLLAYAENISTPQKLTEAMHSIAARHYAAHVKAEYYPVVGHYLLAALKELLGQKATPELLEAWDAAYTQLADLMIKTEQDMYKAQAAAAGGWSGWRPFVCIRRAAESADVISLYLQPADHGVVPTYLPGQFICVRVPAASGEMQPRPYTLTSTSRTDGNVLRISVKRTSSCASAHAGAVSGQLHDCLQEGDTIEVTAPAGNFTLNQDSSAPAVFIGGGIGMTPLYAMVRALSQLKSERKVLFLFTTQNGRHFPLQQELRAAISSLPNARLSVFFTHPEAQDKKMQDFDEEGRITAEKLQQYQVPELAAQGAEFYVCGPEAFMKNILSALQYQGAAADQLHYESFGNESL